MRDADIGNPASGQSESSSNGMDGTVCSDLARNSTTFLLFKGVVNRCYNSTILQPRKLLIFGRIGPFLPVLRGVQTGWLVVTTLALGGKLPGRLYRLG